MAATISAEAIKVRSTRTVTRLVAAMAALVGTVVALHGVALDESRLTGADAQLSMLIGWGALLGPLFAGLAAIVSYTVELRHRTIAATLLATPRRADLVIAKATVGAVTGVVFGAAATVAAVISGEAVLVARGITSALGAGDIVQFIVGGTVAGGLWALVGLGIGIAIRDQLVAGAGLAAWTLFVEGILVDTVPAIGRAAPGALARGLAGVHADTLAGPALATAGLAAYAAAGLAAALVLIGRDHA